jgi:hypothetical protein
MSLSIESRVALTPGGFSERRLLSARRVTVSPSAVGITIVTSEGNIPSPVTSQRMMTRSARFTRRVPSRIRTVYVVDCLSATDESRWILCERLAKSRNILWTTLIEHTFVPCGYHLLLSTACLICHCSPGQSCLFSASTELRGENRSVAPHGFADRLAGDDGRRSTRRPSGRGQRIQGNPTALDGTREASGDIADTGLPAALRSSSALRTSVKRRHHGAVDDLEQAPIDEHRGT